MVARNAERADRKRTQIREGACEVFLTHGFASASTDQVAMAAGVSKQTLYSYFRSKEELLVAVFSHLLEELADPSEVWDREVRTREDLRAILLTLAVRIPPTAMQERYLSLVRVVLSELRGMPELGDLWRTSVPAVGMQRIQAILRRGQVAGVVRDVDVDLATRMFFGPILTFIILDGVARPGDVLPPDGNRLEELVDLYLRAIT